MLWFYNAGSTCEDPGTPPGAYQVALGTSGTGGDQLTYEVNYYVGFNCSKHPKDGMVYVGDVLKCEVSGTGNGTIGWSGTVGKCEGMMLVFS